MKTTIDLPHDLVREVKLRAVREGRPVKYLVADLLRESLRGQSIQKMEPIQNDRIIFSETGVPVIQCRANALARQMSAEQLIAQENEVLYQEEVRRAGVPL